MLIFFHKSIVYDSEMARVIKITACIPLNKFCCKRGAFTIIINLQNSFNKY